MKNIVKAAPLNDGCYAFDKKYSNTKLLLLIKSSINYYLTYNCKFIFIFIYT